MTSPIARRITIELEFSAPHDHPMQNMAKLEQLLKAALENGVTTADAEIPPVYSAEVMVLATEGA